MGNLTGALKRFIGNKNTVTILAVIAGILILWYFYNYRVNEAITTISVPYAVERIDSGKKIETDNIQYKEVTSSTTRNSEIITNSALLEGKYICTGNAVPKDGFFYTSQVCDKEAIKNSVYDVLPDGYTLYNLPVDSQMTYADSIMPGDYIDLYLSATDDNNKVIYGKLIESIEVLRVRDSSGRDLFWDSDASNSAYLLFTISDEFSKILNVADRIRGNNIEIIPVPRDASYTKNPSDTKIASDDLKNFILRNAASISD